MSISKYIFGVAILIVIGAGAWYLAPASQIEENDHDEEGIVSREPVVTIVYTNDGYTPSEVTVKKGETVRFMNNSSDQETWPASAIHPTHSIYPEKSDEDCLGSSFDSCRGLKSGEYWDFTFNEVGEWRFHDHVHASKTGAVNVSE